MSCRKNISSPVIIFWIVGSCAWNSVVVLLAQEPEMSLDLCSTAATKTLVCYQH